MLRQQPSRVVYTSPAIALRYSCDEYTTKRPCTSGSLELLEFYHTFYNCYWRWFKDGQEAKGSSEVQGMHAIFAFASPSKRLSRDCDFWNAREVGRLVWVLLSLTFPSSCKVLSPYLPTRIEGFKTKVHRSRERRFLVLSRSSSIPLHIPNEIRN